MFPHIETSQLISRSIEWFLKERTLIVNKLSQSENTFTESTNNQNRALVLPFDIAIQWTSLYVRKVLLVFRGYKMGTLARDGLIRKTFMYHYLCHHTGAISAKEIRPEF